MDVIDVIGTLLLNEPIFFAVTQSEAVSLKTTSCSLWQQGFTGPVHFILLNQ